MFKISWELGIGSLVLISTIFCICFVLKRITTIVNHDDALPNYKSNIDPNLISTNPLYTNDKKKSVPTNLIPGLESNIFEKFKKNLNLNSSSENSKKIYSENFNEEKDNNLFSSELNEKENIRVTISKNAKNLNDSQNIVTKDDNDYPDDIETLSKNENNSHVKILGAGEEALKILSSKQKILREQTENSPIEDSLDNEEDLFEEELIPIPGGEDNLNNNDENLKNEKVNTDSENSFMLEEDNFLEKSITNNQTESEQKNEAEALLKLAISSCEAGRIEEARAALKIYIESINDLNLEPSEDLIELAKKLDVQLKTNDYKKTYLKNNGLILEKEVDENPLLKEIPEQANYANVMDGLVKSLEEKEAFEEALPLLKDLIEYNKKRENISYLDNLYDRIEQVYSSLKNDDGLVSAYKEHLSIKKKLSDLEGELNLLDLISYYYANTGDQKASKRFQTESKKVKKLIEQKIISEKNL